MKIGCHLSSSGGYVAMAQTALSIGANVFQFFTRNPRGGAAKPLDKADAAAFRDFAAKEGIGPILAHAPYTLNAASGDARIRDFAESVFTDDLTRLEATPGALYNFHPGSHVGLGAEQGIANICDLLLKVFANVGGYAGGSESPCALSFEDGATITVNLAGRTDLDEIASAHGLVATWAEDKVPDASTTFVLDPETAALPHEYYLRKTSEGLSLRKTEATTIFIR